MFALLAGCRPALRVPAGAPVADDAGDTARVVLPAHRIVSLNPAATELLFAIGAGSDVVGRTAWCDYPPEAKAVPSLGDGINPNLEAIVARKPDLVLLYTSGQNAEAARRLANLGIPALRFRTDSLSDVPRLARVFGRLTGREPAADSVARSFEADLASATVPAPARRPTVFLLVWDQPPMTVGQGSFLTELIERAGGENVFADVASSSAPVSIEAVAARNPDVILLLGNEPPAFAERPEWQVVRAVREQRFVRADGSEFSRPSPRAPQAIRRLHAELEQAR
jgi:ABC-type Fe3+-hydroxamate transport system substrate-binding protein